jgi:hypothetical protein
LRALATAVLFGGAVFPLSAAPSSTNWPGVTLLSPNEVALRGALGDSLRRGVARMEAPDADGRLGLEADASDVGERSVQQFLPPPHATIAL